jgi:hypothetical protein
MQRYLTALNGLVQVLDLYGVNLLKGTVNGVRLPYYDFRLLLYFMSLGVGVEVDRDQIIEDTYTTLDHKPTFRIKPHSIDSFLVRVNKALDRAKFEYRIRNHGNPRNPRGFQLEKAAAMGLVTYEEVGEQ